VKIFLPLPEFEALTVQPLACSLYRLSHTAESVHGNDQCGHASSRRNQVFVNKENAQSQQKLFI
jgi:hypothetical protein